MATVSLNCFGVLGMELHASLCEGLAGESFVEGGRGLRRHSRMIVPGVGVALEPYATDDCQAADIKIRIIRLEQEHRVFCSNECLRREVI